MTDKGDLRKLVRRAQKQGWTFQGGGSRHNILVSPDGKTRLSIVENPGSAKALKAFEVRLRNAGVTEHKTGAKRRKGRRGGHGRRTD